MRLSKMQPLTSGDPDEEIVTLPETPTSPVKPSSPYKRHRLEEANGKASKKAAFGKETLLSSGDSSPDPDSPENQKLKNGSGEKVPPKTFPKPDWYLRARSQVFETLISDENLVVGLNCIFEFCTS
jgi:hypothetical protein